MSPISKSFPNADSQNPINEPIKRPSKYSAVKAKKILHGVLDDPVETELSAYLAIVEKIKAVDMTGWPDAAIMDRSRKLKAEFGGPDSPAGDAPDRLESVEIEAFALVREAARRSLGLDPFDVQMIAGLALARGRIAELPTGEGKTLAAVFPAFLLALGGEGVHILTVNDYLARRDAAWMGPVYRALGLSVGCIQEGMSLGEKRAAYARDIVYATAKESGFDFLRDQIAVDRSELVHRPFHAAIVDEADSILVDEARIPLIIAGVEDRISRDLSGVTANVRSLTAGRDFDTDAEHRNVFLTDAGIERLESSFGQGSLYAASNQRLLETVYCALHARALLRRDVDYIVRNGRVEIVDEFTGRVVDKRHWPDGLQAAVEAKEGLARRSEGRVLGSITLQHFFKLYPRLCGMTATARSAAGEIKEFYGLRMTVIPPHVPSVRDDRPDAVFVTREAKRSALLREISETRDQGRPVLVGTLSVKESEDLAAGLGAAGIECAVLNAKNDESEARIIADAGRPGAVTISTNMAGRGTDIKLGGADEREREKAMALGGLYVIGTNRHESLRIDNQLRGRSGRQGDPGTTRFFISFEDELFERYGLTESFRKRYGSGVSTEAIESRPVRREVEHSQRIIEGQNFDIRRQLAKYSSLIELQRGIVQSRREGLLYGRAFEPYADDIIPTAASEEAVGEAASAADWPEIRRLGTARFGASRMAEIERRAALFHLDRCWSDHLAWLEDTRESIHLVKVGGKTPLQEFQKSATAEFLDMHKRIDDTVLSAVRQIVEGEESDVLALENLRGPSSTWTYLVSDDQFGWGMDLMSTRNIGFTAIAAAAWGPLYIFVLIVNKVSRALRLRKKTGGKNSAVAETRDQ